MRERRFPLVAYVLSLLLLGVALWQLLDIPYSHRPRVLELRGEAFSIPYHIQVVGVGTEEKDRDKLVEAITSIFDAVDRHYNKWNRESELSYLNDAEAGVAVLLSRPLYTFLVRTAEFVKVTEGRFDPTIEAIQGYWRKALSAGFLPNAEGLISLKEATGWENIVLENQCCTKKHRHTAIDLGGHAKGFTVDLIVEALQSMGYRDLYVEWGGEIRCRGWHPSGRRWRIAIARPATTFVQEPFEMIELCDQAIASSGDHEQKWSVADKEYCHIFNPQKGEPMEIKDASIAAVSVVAPTCCEADVWATALMTYTDSSAARQRAADLVSERPEMAVWIINREKLHR